MKINTAEKYIETRDANGNEYLCPFSDEQGDNNANRITGDDCFEKDVAERYSGNIERAGRDV